MTTHFDNELCFRSRFFRGMQGQRLLRPGVPPVGPKSPISSSENHRITLLSRMRASEDKRAMTNTPVLILPGLGDSGPEHWQSIVVASTNNPLRGARAPSSSPSHGAAALCCLPHDHEVHRLARQRNGCRGKTDDKQDERNDPSLVCGALAPRQFRFRAEVGFASSGAQTPGPCYPNLSYFRKAACA